MNLAIDFAKGENWFLRLPADAYQIAKDSLHECETVRFEVDGHSRSPSLVAICVVSRVPGEEMVGYLLLIECAFSNWNAIPKQRSLYCAMYMHKMILRHLLRGLLIDTSLRITNLFKMYSIIS